MPRKASKEKPVISQYSLPANEEKLVDDLAAILAKETGVKKVSRAEATRQALIHFEKNPTEVNIVPRSWYRYADAFLAKIPMQMPLEMDNKVEGWAEQHSCYRSQVIRQALINFAATKGLSWTAGTEETVIKPEWNEIKINAQAAAELAGVTRTVINRHATNKDYPYEETDEIYGGKNKKRLFKVSDIVSYYNVSEHEVNEFISKIKG